MIIDQIKLISAVGDYKILPILILIIAVIILIHVHSEGDAVFLFLASLSYVYSLILKCIFKIQRPVTADVTKSFLPCEEYSFPSTHVVFYVVFWGFILYLCFKLKKIDKLIRVAVGMVCVYLISTIGLSRYLLGQHWISDIYWGYIFGGIYLLVLILSDKKLGNSSSKDKNKNKKGRKRCNKNESCTQIFN